jgi:hypothetical protein
MKIRPKLSGAPLAYALHLVDGVTEPLRGFTENLWGDERAVSAQLKELVFLRSSIVNECHT